MLGIGIAILVTASLTFLLTRRFEKTESSHLQERHDLMLTMGVQIVCGDCAGEQDVPFRTCLDRRGNCEACGGHSYVLASSLAMSAFAHRSTLGVRRVLPFETAAFRAARKTKVAV